MMPAPPSSTDVVNLGLAAMGRLVAQREIASRDLVQAYLQRIDEHGGQLNAVVQTRPQAALREADAADQAVAAGGNLGPLHGVPVTIKDCFAVEGLQTTLGIPGFSSGPDAEDSPLVSRLRAAGAIVLGKTNVPQGMLLHECCNPLYGRTLHPDSPDRSPGGSSGGEAAAVAAGLSPLGLASDLGGSTRQPAHSCGLVGFKPTSYRLTVQGSRRAMPGMKSLAIAPGPITRTVADADTAMRVLLDPSRVALRPDERNQPWPDYRTIDPSTLRVGYWAGDGIARPAVAIQQAVDAAAKRMGHLGADVRPLQPLDTERMLRIYLGLISADGMRNMGRLIRGRKVDTQLRRQTLLGRAPRWVRRLAAPALSVAGQGELAKLLSLTGPRSADSYWALTVEAEQYRRDFWHTADATFDGQPVDAILTPPHSLPALRHDTGLHLLLEASHCYLANLLDAPAGVVPAGRVTPEQQQAEQDHCGGGLSLVARLRRENARQSEGLPIGVQVMSRPWRDDVALAVMAALEQSPD